MTMLIMVVVVSALVTAGFGVFAWILFDKDHDGLAILSMLLAVVAACACLIFTILIPFYYGAGIQAQVLNKNLGSHVTTDEMFFAGDETKEILRQNMQEKLQRMQIQLTPEVKEILK